MSVTVQVDKLSGCLSCEQPTVSAQSVPPLPVEAQQGHMLLNAMGRQHPFSAVQLLSDGNMHGWFELTMVLRATHLQ